MAGGISFEVSPDYGWVVLVVSSTIFLFMWLGVKVGQARKKYKVEYPRMYIEPYTHVFNCVQRAHQNSLENYPQFLVLLVFAGLLYPRLSALCGAVWVFSRVMYAIGYYTGDPKKRMYGAFGYLGLFTLLGINIMLGLKMTGFIGW